MQSPHHLFFTFLTSTLRRITLTWLTVLGSCFISCLLSLSVARTPSLSHTHTLTVYSHSMGISHHDTHFPSHVCPFYLTLTSRHPNASFQSIESFALDCTSVGWHCNCDHVFYTLSLSLSLSCIILLCHIVPYKLASKSLTQLRLILSLCLIITKPTTLLSKTASTTA